jgi:hypothetical protein
VLAPRNPPLATFYYRQVIRIQPRSPTEFLNLGLLENQTKAGHRQAISDLRQAVRLDPKLRAIVPARLRRADGRLVGLTREALAPLASGRPGDCHAARSRWARGRRPPTQRVGRFLVSAGGPSL